MTPEPSQLTPALIALGGNQGDVATSMRKAIVALAAVEGVNILNVSQLYSTLPVGVDAGSRFVNAALTLRTTLDPHKLLDLLQEIETSLGRVRKTHWGPRVLDLDIILFGDQVIQSPRLVVPHPAAFYRRFVLDPATDVAAEWIHPQFGISLKALRDRLLQRPLHVQVSGSADLSEKLSERFDAQVVNFAPVPLDVCQLVFDFADDRDAANHITLSNVGDPLAHAEQILLAAIDSPDAQGTL